MKNHDFDNELWFTFKEHCKGKHFIVENPHTFHGRISAYCPQKDAFFNVSLGEIDEMPLTTKYWIKGFLSGNEPTCPVDEEGDDYPPTHEEFIYWAKIIELFHITGYWYSGDKHCSVCGLKLLNSCLGFECEKCLEKK